MRLSDDRAPIPGAEAAAPPVLAPEGGALYNGPMKALTNGSRRPAYASAAASAQLDLFVAGADRTERGSAGHPIRRDLECASLDDNSLIAALNEARISDVLALAAEAGRRRSTAAIPALEALCRRFSGFGADRIVPEQAAAIDALAAVGGRDAALTVARLIVRRAVQGPCLRNAVSAAAGLRARLPAAMLLELLHHEDPRIRADGCRCSHGCREAIPRLRDLLNDLHPEVRTAAACALGQMGHSEARALLAHCLREAPSAEVIDAIAAIADEGCIILLGRVARTVPNLTEPVLDALDAIDHPRAVKIAADVRTSWPG